MSFLTRWRQRRRAGQPYDGPAAWSDDYSAIPRPGYYALTADGKTLLPDVPLVCVDDAPGNALDGACHYEYAGPKDYPQRSATGEEIRSRRTVSLEAEAVGHSSTEATQ
jgi:hypothetical protein